MRFSIRTNIVASRGRKIIGNEIHYQYGTLGLQARFESWGLSQERVQVMYVCICNAYRESKVRDAIEEGCDRSDGLTVEQIFARLGRGVRCGSCSSHVENMIAAAREERDHAVTVS